MRISDWSSDVCSSDLTARPLANVTLLAPIPRPRKNIFGIGLNYVEHVEESARTLDTATDLPKQPVIFSKPPTTVIGPGQPVVHRADITQQQIGRAHV